MAVTLILFTISLSIAFVLHYFVNGPSVNGIPHATPSLPLVGSAPWYRRAPVEFLQSQRQKHGDIVLVNLGVLRVVFLLSPEGTNALLKGTEKSGVSLPETVSYLFGDPFRKGMSA
jgi:Cytochrome P450